MKTEIEIDDEAFGHLREMAEEGNLGIPFLCEVAIYNLIALWMKDRGIHIESIQSARVVARDDPADAPD